MLFWYNYNLDRIKELCEKDKYYTFYNNHAIYGRM